MPPKAVHVLAAARSPAVLTGLTECASNQAGVGGMSSWHVCPVPAAERGERVLGLNAIGRVVLWRHQYQGHQCQLVPLLPLRAGHLVVGSLEAGWKRNSRRCVYFGQSNL